MSIRYLNCLIYLVFISTLFFSCGNESKSKSLVLASSDSGKLYNDSINISKKINAASKKTQLDNLFSQKAKSNTFNGCVLIAQQGQIIYKKAFGYADYKNKIPLTTNTGFQLASTSKTLTAAAIMLLKQEGKLNYNDDVKKYFPDFPYEGVTIQLLLTHRSGLPNYMYFCDGLVTDKSCLLSNKAVLDLITKDAPPLYSKPNKKFSYCNTNYCILASIIEKISGINYADFMHDSIFIPLKMMNTWVNTPENAREYQNKTLAYYGNWHIEEGDYLDGIYGDKGIYSTVEDLFKWDQALYNYSLLTKETLDEAFIGYSHEKKGMRNYGFGFRIIDYPDGSKVVYHNGWWHCYNTTFYRRLKDKSTIIILSNKYNKNVYQVNDILSILSPSNFYEPVEPEE